MKFLRILMILCAVSNLVYAMEMQEEVAQQMPMPGFHIKTEGTLFSQAVETRMRDILIKNPSFFLTDITPELKMALQKKQKDLKKRLKQRALIEGVATFSPEEQEIIDMDVYSYGFVHGDYIRAHAFVELLKQYPSLMVVINNLFQEKKQSFEEQPEKSYSIAQVFNLVGKIYSELDTIVELHPDLLGAGFGPDEFSMSYDSYLEMEKMYRGRPFFQLIHSIRECVGCGIARVEVPFVRRAYENKVVFDITHNHPHKSRQISITDFATGELFQTFVVINKLVAAGYKNIRLNIIDLAYNKLLQTYQMTMDGTIADIDLGVPDLQIDQIGQTIDFMFLVSQKEHELLENQQLVNEINKYSIDSSTLKKYAFTQVLDEIIEMVMYNNTLAAFSKWFNAWGVKLDLVAYADANDYVTECNKNPRIKSDVLLAADYYGETLSIFENLRKDTLKKNGLAIAVTHADRMSQKYPGMSKAGFYFSFGRQQDATLRHFLWDLKRKSLIPVSEIFVSEPVIELENQFEQGNTIEGQDEVQ